MKSGIISPQAQAVYDVLRAGPKPLTAKEIASRLDVVAPTIYRVTKQLENIGVVKRSQRYPATYYIVDPSAALPWFLLSEQKKFKQTFAPKTPAAVTLSPKTRTTLRVVKDRDDFLAKTSQDVARAKRSVDFIVSGLEVPDATILLYRKAIAKGVTIRALVQQRHETTDQRLEDWKSIGVEVRYTPYLGMRLFVIDEAVAYLVSYDKLSAIQALGVRYDYGPLAFSLHELFEKKWLTAKVL